MSVSKETVSGQVNVDSQSCFCLCRKMSTKTIISEKSVSDGPVPSASSLQEAFRVPFLGHFQRADLCCGNIWGHQHMCSIRSARPSPTTMFLNFLCVLFVSPPTQTVHPPVLQSAIPVFSSAYKQVHYLFLICVSSFYGASALCYTCCHCFLAVDLNFDCSVLTSKTCTFSLDFMLRKLAFIKR